MKFGLRAALGMALVGGVALGAGFLNAASLARFDASLESLAGNRFAASQEADSAKDHIRAIQFGILPAVIADSPASREAALAGLDREAEAFYGNLDFLERQGSGDRDSLGSIREEFQRYYLFAASVVDRGSEAMGDPAVLSRFGALETALVDSLNSTLRSYQSDFATELERIRLQAAGARSLAGLLMFGSLLLAAFFAWVLSRSLAKPLGALTAAAEAFGRGEFGARTGYRSRDEFGTLALAIDTMAEGIASLTSGLEEKVRERTAELSSANLSLDGALAELRASEARVLLSEKMAALGKLAAGVAHEVNTPLAAIVSSGDELGHIVGGSGLEVLEAYAGLGEEGRALFRRLVGGFSESFDIGAAETRETRAAQKAASAALEAAGAPQAGELAAALADLGALGSLGSIMAALGGEEGRKALFQAAAWAQAIRSTRVIGAAASKAATVVQALRFYTSGQAAGEVAAFDVGLQMSGIAALYRDAERRGIEFSFRVPEGLRARGRANDIGRVWINLINNAVQAIGHRGEVVVEARREGDRLLVSVADTGPGIPVEDQRRIFEPFFTTKRPGEGSGLGLDMARRIVEADGGSISFESRPGHTVFTVALPAD